LRVGGDQGRQPGPAIPLGTVRVGRLGLLGFQDRWRTGSEDRPWHRSSAGGCFVLGVFVSPQAPVQLPGPLSLLLQALVFGSAAAALLSTGHRSLAVVFVVIVVINAALMYVWGQ
jgi:hypothetical protein